jgi:hypothetical protein
VNVRFLVAPTIGRRGHEGRLRVGLSRSLGSNGHSPDASLIVPIDNLWVGRADYGMIRGKIGPEEVRK